MKKLIIATLSILLALTSCSDMFRDELAELHGEIDNLKELKPGKDTTTTPQKTIDITFSSGSERIGISANETIAIEYTLSEGDANTIVAVATDGQYTATVSKTDNTHGVIKVTCPLKFAEGSVNVLVYDGKGNMAMRVLEFYERSLEFSSGSQFSVAPEGGTLQIPYTTNFDFNYSLGVNSGWLSVKVNKTSTTNGTIVVEVPKNTGIARTGYIYLTPTFGSDQPIATITINQSSSYYEIDYSTFLADSNGGQFVSTIKTSRGVKVVIPSDANWVSYSMTSSGNEYKVTFTVSPNTSSSRRDATIEIYATDGNNDRIGVIQIGQLSPSTDNAKMMIFEVRASGVNDYDVYLPLVGRMDCYVYWGDGQTERFRGDNIEYVHHKYNVNTMTTYEVKISGTVTQLSSWNISESHRYGIIAVKQWGMTGLTSMENAFNGIWSLKSIPPDNVGAFSNVKYFREAFSGCESLVEIPVGLFNYGQNIDDLRRAFSSCRALTKVPSSLFEKCTSATQMNGLFTSCTSLTEIPSDLFKGLTSMSEAQQTFYECSSLKSIPHKLFSPLVNATKFNGAFNNCTSLTEVPEDIFAGCSKAETFDYLFYSCRLLTAVPSNLFKDCSRATSFWGTFESTSLKAIPESIFANCQYVRYFARAFCNCTSLTTIPTSLFDNNLFASSFENCFTNCWSVKGESPYTVIDGKKVHLYERSQYPDTFMRISTYTGCFSGASFTDSDNIPDGWK